MDHYCILSTISVYDKTQGLLKSRRLTDYEYFLETVVYTTEDTAIGLAHSCVCNFTPLRILATIGGIGLTKWQYHGRVSVNVGRPAYRGYRHN